MIVKRSALAGRFFVAGVVASYLPPFFCPGKGAMRTISNLQLIHKKRFIRPIISCSDILY
jgi:hypothetical protein